MFLGKKLLTIVFSLNCLFCFVHGKCSPAENNTADFIIFSYDRPLQLYSLLKSVHKNISGFSDIFVLYKVSDEKFENAYKRVFKHYPLVKLFKQSSDKSKNNFKPILMRILSNHSKSKFVTFAVDDIIITDKINIFECVQYLAQYEAYGFYLRLGKNIKDNYMRNKSNIKQPIFKKIDNDVWMWKFSDGEAPWGYPHSVDMNIFRKSGIINDFTALDFNSPNSLEAKWVKVQDLSKFGLCYEKSKLVNIPLNLVQTDSLVNRNMDLFSKEQLLDLFNQGLEIDIEKLQGMENRSTHIHYIPQFKFRDVRKNKEKDIFWNQIKNSLPIQEKKFVVIIASFNNKNWYKVNLDSILSQKYENYKVIYIDDNSTDGTGDLVKEYISAHKYKSNKILFTQNTVRCGATANIYKAIHDCDNDSIIVILDGDDWVKNDHVLALLNKVYSDPNIWLTYGQFERYPYSTTGYCCEIPEEVIKTNSFRSYKWVSSHLRTFYAWLYKRIKLEDFMFDGEFVPVCSDLVTMFPMLEMAGRHVKFISDVLYVYNCINPNSYRNMYWIAKNDSNKLNNMHAIIEPYIRKQLVPYTSLRESDLVKYN